MARTARTKKSSQKHPTFQAVFGDGLLKVWCLFSRPLVTPGIQGSFTQSMGPFRKIRVAPFHPDSLFTMECVQSHWSGKMDGVMLKPIKKVRAHESDYCISQFFILPLLYVSTCGLGWVRYMFIDTPWLNHAFSHSFCWSTIHVWLRYISQFNVGILVGFQGDTMIKHGFW